MNGSVKFSEKTLEAKRAADAIGRALSGRSGMTWYQDVGLPESLRDVWNRSTDLLVKQPVKLWKKMCKGYTPIEGTDYEFHPVDALPANADVGCYGGADDDADDDSDETEEIEAFIVDADESDIEVLNAIEWDAEASIDDSDIKAEDNPFSWLIEAGALPEGTPAPTAPEGLWQPDGTWGANSNVSPTVNTDKPSDPAGVGTDKSWRALLVDEALDEDWETVMWAWAREAQEAKAVAVRVFVRVLVQWRRDAAKWRRRTARREGQLYVSDGRLYTVQGVQ